MAGINVAQRGTASKRDFDEVAHISNYIEYLLTDEYDSGVRVRRGMNYSEAAAYVALKTPGECVDFLTAMGALDCENL